MITPSYNSARGSERILRLMGKTFPLYEWIKTMKDVEKNYPQIRTRTSIMVGFPRETEDDFNTTSDLVKTMLFDRIDVYMYDERPNLPSLRLKGRIPEEIKRKRYEKMNRLAILNNVRKRIGRMHVFY